LSYRGSAQQICFHSNTAIEITPLERLVPHWFQHRDFFEYFSWDEEIGRLILKDLELALAKKLTSIRHHTECSRQAKTVHERAISS
jgi:hypothetical protein